ncbi:hypothetical protein ROZALSC1DRAFT_20406 [Rozella allomycis CSF55]|uniref:Tetratricopeptide repeat protein n=1 Tax=Rozella allomycis (strain CSF55) TaxID=988480 RepID=A0A4P9YPV1_ROZAC|nr:hypothetical protein ROZALSC1DRAFT_20406 [Rozella allomycis CSF55]
MYYRQYQLVWEYPPSVRIPLLKALYSDEKDASEIEKYLLHARDLCSRIKGDNHVKNLNLAQVYQYLLKDEEKALSCYQNVLKMIDQRNDNYENLVREKAAIHQRMGQVYKSSRQIGKAEESFNNAMLTLLELPDEESFPWPKKTLERFKRKIKRRDEKYSILKIPDSKKLQLAAIMECAGELWLDKGDYALALGVYRKAVEFLLQEDPHHPRLPILYNNAAATYSYLGKFREARILGQRAYSAANDRMKPLVLCNLAMIEELRAKLSG